MIELLTCQPRLNIEKADARALTFDTTSWPVVVGCIALLVLLNLIPSIHRGIISLDTNVALALNSMVGEHPLLDKLLAWFNTRFGDEVVLTAMCTVFAVHSFRGSSIEEIARRASFWAWLGALCIIGYQLEGCLDPFVRREIPLAVLPLKNVQTIYGITLRTNPIFSFPSGHATAYIFFAIMAWRRYRRMSLLVAGIGILLLSTRLIVGIHWLSDMTLGALPCSVLIASLSQEMPLQFSYQIVEQIVLATMRFGANQIFGLLKESEAPAAIHSR